MLENEIGRVGNPPITSPKPDIYIPATPNASNKKPLILQSGIQNFYTKNKKVIYPNGKVERYLQTGRSFSSIRRMIDEMRG